MQPSASMLNECGSLQQATEQVRAMLGLAPSAKRLRAATAILFDDLRRFEHEPIVRGEPASEERLQALGEAQRVCRPGGVIVAAAISRFASTLDGLRGGYLEDPEFAAIASADLRDGQHRNATNNPAYFTTAYFHRPEDLAEECAAAGLAHQATLAVEGPAWLLADLDARVADARKWEMLLTAIATIEAEPTLLGVSAHLLVVARR